MSKRLSALLAWAEDVGIRIAPSITLEDDPSHGIAVFAHHAPIPPRTTLVTIPKTALLSARSCALSAHIPLVPCGHGAHLALALAVYTEILKGSASRWHAYLQSLPPSTVPIALFWGASDTGSDDDSDQAKRWIAGTEVENELHTESGLNALDDARAYYASVVTPLLARLAIPSSLSGYLHAYSLVSSRAFLVDAYHGLSMVPIADAFNHTAENHVHLESDFDVCPTCGSLAECPHDRDDALPIASASDQISPSSNQHPSPLPPPSLPPAPDTCDMVTNSPIPAHSEVFNTYGAHLTNAALLARYGFAVPGNPHDAVTWTWSCLLRDDDAAASRPAPLPPCAFVETYTRLTRAWTRSLWSLAADASTLVFRPDLDSLPDPDSDSDPGLVPVLRVNADAQVSVHLWLYAALRAVCALPDCAGLAPSRQGGRGEREGGGERENAGEGEGARAGVDVDVGALVCLLGQVLEDQVTLERTLAGTAEDSIELELSEPLVRPHASHPPCSTASDLWPCMANVHLVQAAPLLREIAHLLCALLSRRIALIGARPDLSVAELGALLDVSVLPLCLPSHPSSRLAQNVPADQPKTRLALAHVLSERVILESCAAAWRALADALGGEGV
ncbi:hypothetical protein AcW2_003948 [Taiwanofungus camphoratus]|nr:hypothetical protein AcW2_003948 [Antrodia cinnamomea]